MTGPHPTQERTRARATWIIVAAAALALLALALWRRNDIDAKGLILAVLSWLEGRGLEAIVWILLLQALLVVLAIPGPYFTMASGFLFGLWGGLAVAVCASTLGAVTAYGIARSFPRWKGFESAMARPSLRVLESFVREGGWKVVLSTRLIPLFPFKLSNYFFGWIRFPFGHFVAGTFLGIIPMTMVSVAVGSLASNVADLLHPARQASPWTWGVSLGGLALAIALFAYAGLQAREKLRRTDAGVAP